MRPRARAAPAPWPARARAALLGLLSSLALALGGCAVLGDTPGAPADAARPGSTTGGTRTAQDAMPVVRVEIDAPAPLRALLEQHLELSRLARLSRGDAVTDTELQRLVDATPSGVRELLRTEGYFRPEVSVERVGVPAAGQPETVRVHVQAGPQVHVQHVTLDVQGELEVQRLAADAHAIDVLERLRHAWALPVGHAFRDEDWRDAKTATLARLRAAGYAAAVWSGTAAEIDDEAATARLFLVADSGPLFRSGAIRVQGLQQQDESTVLALAEFPAGTPLTEALLLEYQDRLQRAGLFESVSVTLDPDPTRADAATVLVQLREQAMQVYIVGVGISANTGPRASLEHVYRRVLGYSVSSSNQFELGRVRQAWNGEVSTHPGERFSRWLLGGAIERLVSSQDVVMSQRLRLGRSQDTRVRERLVFAEVERGVRSTDAGSVWTFAVSGNVHLTFRHLDSILLPTEGYTLALQGGLGRSHGSASRSGPFARTYGRLTVYQPLGQSWYGQARIELGQVFLPQGVAAPESQLFRAGGDDSVRGYGYRTLGPVTNGVVGSGPVLATGSIEFARPFIASMPSLWGAVFVDAGRAGHSFRNLNPALGYGVGIRWRSPVGPLRLDIAYGQEVQHFRLHFSVGIAF
ncbi:MAG TPA: BamA/TamA family outer membrane protein [Rubrivivax sp.]|nr:BamA/TamA family outer membrane protein [Burkholderiales bacterium]HNU11994.1 BamA/TamA family outer membrane protein [Rubrivivax sp.]